MVIRAPHLVECSAVVISKFLTGQEVPHLHFALGPTNYVAGTFLGHWAIFGDVRFGINHTNYSCPSSTCQ